MTMPSMDQLTASIMGLIQRRSNSGCIGTDSLLELADLVETTPAIVTSDHDHRALLVLRNALDVLTVSSGEILLHGACIIDAKSGIGSVSVVEALLSIGADPA